MDKYELNDFRVAVLTKLQGKLHDNIVDQVSSDWSSRLPLQHNTDP